MLKYFKTALILTIISGVCALLIAGVNSFTSKVIAANEFAKKEAIYQEIFPEYDGEKTGLPITEGFTSSYILEKVEAKNSNGELIGYVYTVSGSNAYGEIELLVGITADGTLESVQFLTNGQSFSTETENHVNGSYTSGLTSTDVNNIDTACGATYGAKLVKELVSAAFSDSQQGGGW